ncbi:amidohydrolase family protein [Sphingomonas bacterium]|uniref:amidohydrolase family protein n=1 Tax=Sphingomonas bacterium TaxID=1895847 RepID=UPI0020C731BD|nr:amidohydrolase family protein [Sphingomonas bacterium]
MAGTLLIRQAELLDGRIADIFVADRRIVAIDRGLPHRADRVIDAGDALLLPGLHDHHIHVAATAAASASVRCGPPEVRDAEALARALSARGEGWLRGIGYHDSVAGPIDRRWLDAVVPDRPVRVQHRSGRLWVFNSIGLERLLAYGLTPPEGLERSGGEWTGRLYDEDAWARRALGGEMPSFDRVGATLARYGVTGVTEMSPANDDAVARHFAGERARGALPQQVLIAGTLALGQSGLDPSLRLGPVKLHLHEAHLPDYDDAVRLIRSAHARRRGVAVHCVTEVELLFTLAALREAGTVPGDRIEHASVAPDHLVAQIAELRLAVVAQPNFVAERGDAYRADIAEARWPELYRLRAFAAAGVPFAAGSDAPFGAPDPWAAMAATVSRRTAGGHALGTAEALTPEEALALFLADPIALDRTRSVAAGAAADLCLLHKPWRDARSSLSADLVRATIIGGQIVHDRIDQPPA